MPDNILAETENEAAVASPDAGQAPADAEGEAKAEGEAEAEATGAPEEYGEFTLPEGVELDADALSAAAPIFKELGLSQDQAQKLVDFYATRIGEVTSGVAAQAEALQQGWQNEIKAEWGSAFDANVAIAAKAVALGGDELRSALIETGAGNHPAVIKFFHKVGQSISEDKLDGNTKTPKAGGPKTAEELVKSIYPTMSTEG